MAANLPKTTQPRWFCGISFTDPNDAGTPRVWHDFTAQLRAVTTLTRGGAIYELGQSVPAQPKVYLRDVNEDLNPDNTSSPYAGNILPYRPICWLGTWPQVAGNLLNSGAWRVPFDPGFESTTVGTQPAWVTAAGGTSPVVGTTTPRTGSRDLTYTVVNTTSGQGFTWTAYTMPGTQYTVSAWVRQSSASTQIISAAGSAGSSTSTTGAYVQLTKTFTAADITTTFSVLTGGGAVAGTVLIDDLRLEEGASATSSTGSPVVYPLFSGFAERFDRFWPSNGYEGEALVTCVDSLAALNAANVSTEYMAALSAAAPDYWWSLSSDQYSSSFPDISGNGHASLVNFSSSVGAGTLPAVGVSTNIVGDPGGTGVTITPGGTGIANQAGTVLGTGFNPGLSTVAFPASIGSSWAATVATWVTATPNGTSDQGVFQPNAPNTSVAFGAIETLIGGASHHFNVFAGGGTSALDSGGGSDVLDGKPHLLIGTVTQVNGGNTTATTYVDGVQVDTQTVTTASLGGMVPGPSTSLAVGGRFRRTSNAGPVYYDMVNGTISHMALWNRALSAGEITTLWQAGGLAHSGETSGTRVARHLALGGYTGPSRISAGSSVMGPPSYSGSIKLLPDTQNTTVAEGGCLWAAADGAIVFEGRQDRWLRLSPIATFGENVAGGEIPYDGDISLALDPQYVYGDVQVTQSNGPTATGGRTADIATALKRFFGKQYAATVDLLNVVDCQSLADWTFYTHNRPLTRAAVLTIEPARGVGTGVSLAGTWAQALSLEIGQRVRAKRRASAGNSGAGVTVSLDFFIEAVTYDEFNADTGDFVARFLLSPIGSATVGSGVTLQPWILGDATYGVLGQTSVLGW